MANTRKTAAIDLTTLKGGDEVEQFKQVAPVKGEKQPRTLKQILQDNLAWQMEKLYPNPEKKQARWFQSAGGQTMFHVKINSTLLTLPNGKTSAVVDDDKFVETMKGIAQLIDDGFFDDQLEALRPAHEAKLASAAATRAKKTGQTPAEAAQDIAKEEAKSGGEEPKA